MIKNEIDYENTHKTDIDILEHHKVYSPMYDKTFDKMTTAEQKAQLDLWVEDGSFEDMTNYPFKKKLTKDQRDNNFKKFVRGKVK